MVSVEYREYFTMRESEQPRLKADVDSLKKEIGASLSEREGDPQRTTGANDSRPVCRGDVDSFMG